MYSAIAKGVRACDDAGLCDRAQIKTEDVGGKATTTEFTAAVVREAQALAQ